MYATSQYYVRRCGLFLQTEWRALSVGLSVCHNREPCKIGWTDLDAVWGADSGGPKEARILRWR